MSRSRANVYLPRGTIRLAPASGHTAGEPTGASGGGASNISGGRANMERFGTDLSAPQPLGGRFGGGGFDFMPGGDRGGFGQNNVDVISRVKNPALDNIQTQAMGRYQSNRNASDQDLSDYLSAASAHRARAGQFADQEGNAIGELYNGNTIRDLLSGGQRYYDRSSSLISGAQSDLGGVLDRYSASEGAAIGAEATERNRMRGDYGRTAGDTLKKAMADLADQRVRFGESSRELTRLSIADADKQRKLADVASGGYGGSSYFNRQAMDVRTRANAALSGALADRERGDFGLTHAEEVRLNEDLANRERTDYGMTREQSARLAASMADQRRGDIGFGYGERSNLERDYLSQGENARRFVIGQQGAMAGARGRFEDEAIARYLQPISVRNAAQEAELRQLGALGEIDRGNRFYGLTDNDVTLPNFNPGVPSRRAAPEYRLPVGGEPYAQPLAQAPATKTPLQRYLDGEITFEQFSSRGGRTYGPQDNQPDYLADGPVTPTSYI